MVEKRDTGQYVTAAAAVEIYFDVDLGFFRGAGRSSDDRVMFFDIPSFRVKNRQIKEIV